MKPIRFVIVALAGMVTACAAQAPGARPGDMSAAEHRSAARAHAQTASEHEQQYDRSASASRPATYGLSTVRAINSDEPLGTSTVGYGDRRYNPTEEHRDHAEDHREHARQHAAAASALEGSTDAACRQLPPEVHAECPLVGAAAVERVPDGVRVRLSPKASVSGFVARARCHQAVARERRLEGMTACPLFLPKVEVEALGDGSILIRSSEPAIAAAIQERAVPDDEP
jgi:hypothetical protein